jgi:tetratricopeptide (TPR) repeat protein
VLDQLTNIGQHLRDKIPTDKKCDGLRIDRCYYDAQGVFRIEGLADRDGQTKELKPFLDGKGVPFDQKRQLAKGWDAGRQTVIPLWPMMVSLAENLPSLPEFDGLVLERAHHDPKNQLVLTGHAIGEQDIKKQTEILKHLLDTHPRWRLRLKDGFVLNITDKKPADAELAKNLALKGLALLQVNIGEARVDALPVCNGWWSHAWPYDERQKRVKPTNAEYDEALRWLGTALRHDPNNVLAWYLRGYILQTLNRSDLTLRDYRRMVALELDDEDLRARRILDLELVQGRLRQSAFAIERNAILEVSDGCLLRSLSESPAARDATK